MHCVQVSIDEEEEEEGEARDTSSTSSASSVGSPEQQVRMLLLPGSVARMLHVIDKCRGAQAGFIQNMEKKHHLFIDGPAFQLHSTQGTQAIASHQCWFQVLAGLEPSG